MPNCICLKSQILFLFKYSNMFVMRARYNNNLKVKIQKIPDYKLNDTFMYLTEQYSKSILYIKKKCHKLKNKF